MPIRSSAPLGAPTWIDLLTSDLDRCPGVLRRGIRLDVRVRRPRIRRLRQRVQGRPARWPGLMGNDPQFRITRRLDHVPAHRRHQRHHRQGHGRRRGELRRADGDQGQGLDGAAHRSHRRLRRLVAASRAQRLRGGQRGRCTGLPPADHPRLRQGARLLPPGVRLADRNCRPTPTNSGTAQQFSTAMHCSA